MSVKSVASAAQLKRLLGSAPASVLDFSATWCGPCKTVAPIYESLAQKFDKVQFLKTDIDEAQELAADYRISAVPTFVFFKGEEKIQEVRGANPSALSSIVEQLNESK